MSKKLSREEKLAYVEQMLLKKKTTGQVAEETGYSESGIYKWLRKYQENPSDFMPGSGNLSEKDKQIKQLEKELREMKEQVKFLKKATAYFIKNPE